MIGELYIYNSRNIKAKYSFYLITYYFLQGIYYKPDDKEVGPEFYGPYGQVYNTLLLEP